MNKQKPFWIQKTMNERTNAVQIQQQQIIKKINKWCGFSCICKFFSVVISSRQRAYCGTYIVIIIKRHSIKINKDKKKNQTLLWLYCPAQICRGSWFFSISPRIWQWDLTLMCRLNSAIFIVMFSIKRQEVSACRW